MSHFSLILLLTFAIGCSSQDQENIPQQAQSTSQQTPASTPNTAYGNAEQIQTYLQKINPYIQEVGKIQFQIDQQVGSSGQATAANLAPAMEKYKPGLQKILDEFSLIEAPPLLASFHGDVKKLMILRLEAYNTTIRGWAKEQETGEHTLYEDAEIKLKEANELIAKLNAEMTQINQALGDIFPTQTATP